jgi:flagellar assembly protein FliH
MTRVIRGPAAAGEKFKLRQGPAAGPHVPGRDAVVPTPVVDRGAKPPVVDDENGAGRLRDALARAEARVRELEQQWTERCRAQDEETEAQRRKILQDAADEGRQQGLKAGEAAARAELAESIDALERLIESAKKSLNDGLEDLEGLAVEIAFEAVTKVLGQQLRQADGVLALVREVAGRARDQSLLTVRLGPRDYELVQLHREALAQSLNDVRLELVSDSRIAFGGCLVESDSGTLDGRLETQLRRLKDAMIEAYRQPNTGEPQR